MTNSNFLIGRGELLTYDITAPKRGPVNKKEVYSFEESLDRLESQFVNSASIIQELPDYACPDDLAVAKIAMNPSYIAKSYFPTAFLKIVGFVPLGSRSIKITPLSWTKTRSPEASSTTEIFVAGKRSTFKELISNSRQLLSDSKEAKDFARIEQFSAFKAEDRLLNSVSIENDKTIGFFEVGIHFCPNKSKSFIKEAFLSCAKRFRIKVHNSLSFEVGNLWFLPVEGDVKNIKFIADFAFVRVIRHVPKLRGLRPYQRNNNVQINCSLPTSSPLSSEPKVAILDGGLPDEHPIGQWLNSYKQLDQNAKDIPDGLDHGLAVSSAFLFGPIQPNGTAARPYSYFDHLRVLDGSSKYEDPLELYRTLGLIEEVLLSRAYQFINLSLGPDLPIEDNEVHAWTSVIDDLLSNGETFMTVAVGNNGNLDRASGNARIQVPSDCVNAISVGASNSVQTGWSRAGYSAIGPGRSPGVVKPDLIAFGGDPNNYFHVLSRGKQPSLIPNCGTSFAAPYLLRSAVGIRAVLGKELTPLSIKALLIHCANMDNHHKTDVGWGKAPDDIMEIISCADNCARIVYQGELKPGKYLRAELPLPSGELNGTFKIKATFCFATPTDPHDAASYTKAGLDITFRPHKDKSKNDGGTVNSKSFLDYDKFTTEEEKRSNQGKWETVLHGSKNMKGSSLSRPVFDIHYNARESGQQTRNGERIRYALIITVEAEKHTNLYSEILNTYSNILIPIEPQVSLPIRV